MVEQDDKDSNARIAAARRAAATVAVIERTADQAVSKITRFDNAMKSMFSQPLLPRLLQAIQSKAYQKDDTQRTQRRKLG